MFRKVLIIFLLAGTTFGQDVDDIVKKAIEATKEDEKKGPQILKVTKKANGDVETIYVIPGGQQVAIEETDSTKGMPDDRQMAKDKEKPKETSKEAAPEIKKAKGPMDGVFAIVNGRKYSFNTHTPESANAALAATKSTVVFVNAENDVVEAPSWYKKAALSALPPPPSQAKALPPPQRALPPPQRQAPAVAQGFPTTRPTFAPNVGPSSISSPGSTRTAPTITYAQLVGPGGGTGRQGRNDCPG